MAVKPVTVSQLNNYISQVLGLDPILGNVVVKGEISGVKYHESGHVYFSLVDEASKINCFLPCEYASALRYTLDNGMEVILTAAVSVYIKNGTYSLYVKDVEVSGEGSLAMAFEKMKEKLRSEGLFDAAHKKPLPAFPKKIGVITSGTGAAVRDIIKIIRKRNDYVDVTVFPVLVQGERAAGDIASMIDYVNRNHKEIDILIVGRGGGSVEDLWAFNEEIVARSIYSSTIPVISAVGHETDFTISDFTADKRAETPTAAAQMAVPDMDEIRRTLSERKNDLSLLMNGRLKISAMEAANSLRDITEGIKDKIKSCDEKAERLKLILEENSPVKILEEGYSILTDMAGKAVRSAAELNLMDYYNIRMKDGRAKCQIVEVNHEGDKRSEF